MEHKDLQNIARATISYLKTVIRPGMNLREIRQLAEDNMLSLGANSFWYWDIGAFVFAGDETAISVSGRNYTTSDRVIGADDIITVDLSPQKAGIWGDYARTIILENGKVADSIGAIQNSEWRRGLETEEMLHREMLAFVTPDTTFEALYLHINRIIADSGFVNLDFLGNLGHSIVRHKDDRVYIEKGNQMRLSHVECFTFEPHISLPDSVFGYKMENIYRFVDGKPVEV